MDEQASFETRAVLGPNRARNRFLILVPAIALVAAVWLGISGSGTDTRPPATSSASAEGGSAAAYPATVLGIEVRTVADIHRMAIGAEPVTAVAGWFVAWPPLGCLIRDATDPPALVAALGVDADVRTFCNRSGALTATPTPSRQRDATPGLFAVLTPGLAVPAEMAVPDAAPIEVVLVGRVVAMRQPTDQVAADRQLIVTGVAWANGVDRPPTTSILPKLLDRGPNLPRGPRDGLADAMIGPTGAVLIETLVDPATLAFVDPEAAALVASTSPRSERIWYRLALSLQPARIPPRWVTIDDTTGAVLGTGILGSPSVTVVN